MWMINTVRQNTMCMMTEVGSIVLGQWFSKHHPQINSISVRREVVKNANSTCQTWCIRHAEDRPRMQGGFNSPQEILCSLEVWEVLWCFYSVCKSCPTLYDPMDCSTPGSSVLHYLPESAQAHVHRVGDAIQPSHPLWSPSPSALNLSQHQGL